MTKALHGGTWFVFGNFLTVKKWELNFVPGEMLLTSTAIWIRFPQLPIEFYDYDILERIGSRAGKILKIDSCIFKLKG